MSGELPAARILDPTAHATPAAPGTGASTVLIEGRPAWRTILDEHACPLPTPTAHGPERIYLGSTTVLINDKMACRMADCLQGMGPPNFINMGSPTVIIGDVGFGMGNTETRLAFAVKGYELFERWDELKREEQLELLQDALNAALPTGMPKLTLRRNPAMDPESFGQFSFRRWSVEVKPDLFNNRMDVDTMGQLLNTAYHEARHAEQWWNAAQYLANEGKSAKLIKATMYISTDVAEAAVEHPAATGTSEGAMGETVHTSVYGARSSYREEVMTVDSEHSYDQYRSLPEEEDAWRHGDEVELEFGSIVRSVEDV